MGLDLIKVMTVDEKKKLEEEGQDLPKQGSGSLLAAARKQQNKTVEEIADALNLSATQIRTIELDQSEGLPEPTYVRGYIRSYARLLGLDVDEVLDHYLNPNWQKGSRLDDIPRGIGSASENDSRSFLPSGKVVFIILVAALIGFLWLTGKLDSLIGRQQTSATALIATNTVDSNTLTQSSESLLEQEDLQGSNLSDADEPIEASEATVSENQLVLTFTDVSWVDIRDGDGNRLAFKNYVQGEDLTVTATTPMQVFLGNAEAVAATFNGEPYDIVKPSEAVFARFSVGE